jgi:putative GTP pyrophosphokinase
MVKTAIKKNKRYDDINDKLGFRLVTHFKSEINPIKKFINKNFNVVHFESKAEKLKFDQLGYVSEHYEVKIMTSVPYFKEYTKFENCIIEIQIRTICQHAWADVEHALAYKQEIELDANTKRKIFRLTSLLEICDDEFDKINFELLDKPEFIIFFIMKKVEGKFFKFAKMRYDRELSFENISNLKELVENGKELNNELKKINDFVDKNEIRIRQIFKERKEELKRNIFLSQPEIFIIWYMIELKEHDLIKIWQQHYDINDLSELSIWWGKPITFNQ